MSKKVTLTNQDGESVEVELHGMMAVDYRAFDHSPCPVCGDVRTGGSHYHCPICEEETSMYGHWEWENKTYRCQEMT